MKVVILAGGYGTRISEESQYKPKPMVDIGGMPILWHIMKTYSSYGFNEFIICAGYKQEYIKQWFSNYYTYISDVCFDFGNGKTEIINKKEEPWKVTIIDTGLNTNTGGRLHRVQKYIGNERFLLTYGDGVSDININKLVEDHQKACDKKPTFVTVSSYNYKQHKGVLTLDENNDVISFREKSDDDGQVINIGYMVCEPQIFDYIEDDSTPLEDGVLTPLTKQHLVHSYVHNGFWQCMDTLREKIQLEKLWDERKAPWKIW